MTKFEDRKPRDEDTLIRRIEELERRLQQLGSARRMEAATIGRGGVTIQGGKISVLDYAGREIVVFGRRDELSPAPDGTPQPGFAMRRSDGSLAMTLDDPLPTVDGYNQILRMFDRSGNEIMAEDTTSGYGLAAPTLSHPWHLIQAAAWPNTTSATMLGFFRSFVTTWNPFVEVYVYAQMTAGTGSVELLANGVSQGAQAVGTGLALLNWRLDMEALGSGNTSAQVNVEIQGRRTSVTGTDTLRMQPHSITGARS